MCFINNRLYKKKMNSLGYIKEQIHQMFCHLIQLRSDFYQYKQEHHIFEEYSNDAENILNYLVAATQTPQTINQREFYSEERRFSFTEITKVRNRLTQDIMETINSLRHLKNNLVQHLQCCENVDTFESSSTLDKIQILFEHLTEYVCETRTIINGMQCLDISQGIDDEYNHYAMDIEEILRDLIRSSFLIVQQPPQHFQKHTRFSATIRCLLSNARGITETVMTAYILPETTANDQKLTPPDVDKVGAVSNDKRTFTLCLSHNEDIKQCLCNMQNMCIKELKHSGTWNERHVLMFQSTVKIFEIETDVKLISRPIVVFVHRSEESMACAAISWEKTFTDVNRALFSDNDQIPWTHMAMTLQAVFNEQTKCMLTDSHIQYFYEKVFNREFNPNANSLISWKQFSRDALPGRRFSFWQWFYAAMKLVREHLTDSWQKNQIIGFIQRSRTEEILKDCTPGTFLLRFSDTVIGGITVAWSERDHNGRIYTRMIEPYCLKDFQQPKRTISDHLKKLDTCIRLYGGGIKEQEFTDFLVTNKK